MTMLVRTFTLLFICLCTSFLFANNGDPNESNKIKKLTLCSGEEMSWEEYQLIRRLRAHEYDLEVETFHSHTTSVMNNTLGAWSSVIDMPLVTAAAANMPDGRIMTWSARDKLAFGGDQGRTWTAIFDPQTNSANDVLVENTGHDMFCPGINQLPDGRVLVGGGSSSGKSSIFDPFTGGWSTNDAMNIPRGYHSNVTLASGASFTIGGSWSGGQFGKDSEIWSEKTGWYQLPGVPVDVITDGVISTQSEHKDDYFPWLHVAPNGKLFHAGPSATMHWIDPEGTGSYTSAGQRGNDVYASSGTCVMYDEGKLLKIGGAISFEGGETASNSTYVIDINSNTPQVSQVDNLTYSRVYLNAVVLPTGEVLALGGIPLANVFTDTNSRLIPELWNPSTGQWTNVAAMTIPRNYHSVSLLMMDGRVFISGGGLCNSCTTNHPDAQIYSPPYLFNANGTLATRPVINSSPAAADFNTTVTVNTNSSISSFALVRMSAVTHSTNNDQRRIPVNATSLGGNNYSLSIPNKNIVPPGNYMLFAMNGAGTPSVAKVINIGDDINDCTPQSHPNLGGTGLEGTYYNNTDLTAEVLTRQDPTINFSWGTGAPASGVGVETFSVNWQGTIEVPRTGTYTFYTNSDDGVRLRVAGKLMVDNWTDHGLTEDIGMIHLVAGQSYPIIMDYYENTGNAAIQLRWSGPGIEKAIIASQYLFPPCGQDNDNDGICANEDCNDNNPNLPTTVGSSCNDGNSNTTNDIIQSDGCTCAGTPVGGGGDCSDVSITTGSGTINVNGLNAAAISHLQVFDGNWQPYYSCVADCAANETINAPNGTYYLIVRLYTAGWSPICEINETVNVGGGGGGNPCDGQGGDADNDGVCANQDCNDNNPNLPTTVGSSCNDGNSNTTNDVIQSDGCTCAGTPVGGGGDCSDVSISTGSGTITVSGLNATAISHLQVFDGNWQPYYNCVADCAANETINAPNGTYYLIIRLYTANWVPICEINETVNVGGGGGGNPCDGQGGDADNDGVCANQDCNDNNPNLPTTVGSSCNDGNSNTTNDVIQSDGCTCAGTPVGGGGDCGDITFSTGSGTITVGGLNSSPISQLKIFNTSWALVYTCAGDCNATVTQNVANGTYYVYADLYTASWAPICQVNQTLTVGGGGGGCTDNDNDGYCANEDCNDNNPNLPTTVGSACNDGNSNTTNDVIQSDGCTCAGTPVGGGGDCDGIVLNFGASQLTVSGLGQSPVSILQVYNSQWVQVFNCAGNCNATEVISSLPQDTYFVRAQLLNANWTEICKKEVYVTNGSGVNLVVDEVFFFDVYKEGRAVQLNWATNTEDRNEAFVIERSTNGIDFSPLSEVASNSEEIARMNNYLQEDTKPINGMNYYRIKKLHRDGSFEYSLMRQVRFDVDLTNVSIYPNPTAAEFFVNLQKYTGHQANVKVHNNLGQLVLDKEIAEVQTAPIELDASTFQSGVYMVTVTVDGYKPFTKILVVNKL